MDDGYKPSWNDCYAKINEMYKENSDLRAKIGKYEIQLKQAQKMIDELEMLRVKLTEKNNELHEEINGLTDNIDYIQ